MLKSIHSEYKKALRISFIIHLGIYVFLYQIQQVIFLLALIPLIAYLMILPVILIRRPSNPTPEDLMIVRIGPELFMILFFFVIPILQVLHLA